MLGRNNLNGFEIPYTKGRKVRERQAKTNRCK